MFAVLPKSNKSAKEKTQRRLKFKSGFGSTISQKYMFQHWFSNFCLPKCAFNWIFLAPTGVLYITSCCTTLGPWGNCSLFDVFHFCTHVVLNYILLQYFLTTYSIFCIFVLIVGVFIAGVVLHHVAPIDAIFPAALHETRPAYSRQKKEKERKRKSQKKNIATGETSQAIAPFHFFRFYDQITCYH